MRNKAVKKAILPILGLSLVLGSSLVLAAKPKEAEQVSGYNASSLPTTIDLNDTTDSNIRSYYSSLNSLSQSERQGTNLLKNLKTILKNGQKYYSYENGENVWKMYEITDRDWDKSPASSISGYNSSTKKITGYSYNSSDPYIHALYINRDVDNKTTAWSDHQQTQWGINREHVWPKAEGFDSSGAGGARGDPRHLMAGNGYANNIHSNYYYGYVKSSGATDCGSKYSNLSGNLKGTSKTLNTGTVFEPQDSDKGDIARSIFYMVARYNYLSGSDSDGIDTNNPNLTLTQNISDWSSSGYTSTKTNPGKLGVLTDLLAWHHADPVDEYEIHRNNLLYTNFTNNRNPFVDFPEWVDYIWGTASYTGSTYNGGYTGTPTGYATPSSDTINGYNSSGETVSVSGVSLNKNSTSIEVGKAETLEATIAPSNATNKVVSWTSSNTSVATVNGGVVRGVAEGNSTITVTTSDGGFNASCSVTVTASSGGGGQVDTDSISFSRSGTTDTVTSGYSLTLTNAKSASDYYQDKSSTVGLDLDLTKTSGTIWATSPTTLSLTVKVGGGSTKDPLTNNVIAYFLDSNGDIIPSSGTTVTTKVETTTGEEYTVTMPATNNVAGIRIHHDKETSYNVRVYSFSLSYGSESQTKSLDSISLDTSDAPTTFNVGDEFSYEGLSVTANYDDGTDDIVVPTSVSTPNMSTAGQKTVTVSYTEGGVTKTATYTITVNAVTLTSIEVSNEKTTYYVGDTFVKPTVTATFSNGSTSDVTNSATFTGYNLSNAGNQTVTVSYTNGTTETTTYSITVTAVSLTSIEISGYTTSFKVGDTFSFGGTVTANYNNGSTSDVTASATFTGYDMSSAGNQTVTVAYGGQSTTYQITVSESSGATDSTQYSLITSTNQLEAGKSYIIASGTSGTVAALNNTTSTNNRRASDVTISNSKITRGSSIMSLTLGGASGAWTFFTENYTSTNGYLTPGETTQNARLFVSQNNDSYGLFSISFNGDAAVITSTGKNSYNVIRYNSNNTSLFACYTSGQNAIYLWKEVASSEPLTSISASVSKTYHVGDSIVTSDITVTGNNGQSLLGFTFADNNYQFIYTDATSGGASTSKTFSNSISYLEMTCSLTVSVSRKAYSAPESESIVLTSSEVFSGIGGGNKDLKNGTVLNEGITYEYYKAYYYNSGSALSFGNGSSQTGYLTNQTAFDTGITNVDVNSYGRSVNIRYSTDGNTWVLKSAADVSDNIYKYFKVDCIGVSGSDYSNITSISITINGAENATNVANYIMYEDTANQCTTKFSVAKTRFEQMSTSERATFMTSDDYVISTARTRLQAWANYLGKTITYSNNDYVISNNNYLSLMLRTNGNSAISIIVVVSILGIGTIACYFFIKRRKPE